MIWKFSKKPSETKQDSEKSLQGKVTRSKIDFVSFYTFAGNKIVPKDIEIFREGSISSIIDSIRSIPPNAFELHPIFDYPIIAQGGDYKKYWNICIPSFPAVSIRIEITSNKKGTVIFHFQHEPEVYSNFEFEGDKTVLSSKCYMEAIFPYKQIMEFSREDLFEQKDQPVPVSLRIPAGVTLTLFEDETLYYDYFLFMDRLFKIDKTIGDIEKKKEIIKEYYYREKEAGRFQLEELGEKVDQAREEAESDEERRIPDSVKREVWRRDGGKCARCGSREKLEFDHIIPFSKGGSNTARNIELLCMDCNRKKSNRI